MRHCKKSVRLKLFQAKSRYHPALHRYLQELLGFLEMAAEVSSEAEKKHAAEGSGSGGDAPAAVESAIDRDESELLVNLSEDDFVAHCLELKSVEDVQRTLGLRGQADQGLPRVMATVVAKGQKFLSTETDKEPALARKERNFVWINQVARQIFRVVAQESGYAQDDSLQKKVYTGDAAHSSRQICAEKYPHSMVTVCGAIVPVLYNGI